MNKEISRHVVQVAFKSANQLSELLPLLKNHCEDEEYQVLRKAIATVSATIHIEIVNEIFSKDIALKNEVEDKIRKYGKII